jgi:hypothetical protein
MINETIKIEKVEAQEFTPLPDNIYQVELLDVNLEKRPTYDTKSFPVDQQEFENTFKFQFTLLAGKDKDGKPVRASRSVWANFIPAYLYIGQKNGKNKLYRITEALLGHQLDLKEEAEMDSDFVNSLIGKQCRIGTKNVAKGDKIFTQVETFYAVDDILPVPALTDEEKETARVKNKQSKTVDYEHGEANPADIPF